MKARAVVVVESEVRSESRGLGVPRCAVMRRSGLLRRPPAARGRAARGARVRCAAGLPDATGSFHREGRGWCGRRQAGPGAPSAGAGPPAAPSAVSYRQTAVDCRLDYLAMSRLSYSMYAVVDAAPPPAAEFGEAPGRKGREPTANA